MEELEQYLSGKLSAEERRRLEEKIADDPALQAELRVREGLRQLRLQGKVDEAATARKDWERRHNRRWLGGIVVAMLLVGMAVFVWFKTQETPPEPPGNQSPPKEAPIVVPPPPAENEGTVPVLPEKKEAKPKQPPIAEQKPSKELPLPAYPSPNLRGEGTENKELKPLLDQLWYTDYPPADLVLGDDFAQTGQLLKDRDFNKAYTRLQRLERKLPANDTLRLLKGYCLMEMGEGAEALAYFEKLEEHQPNWQPQLAWHRGLSLLLMGDKAKALAAFKIIAKTPNHPYRKQGELAASLLE